MNIISYLCYRKEVNIMDNIKKVFSRVGYIIDLVKRYKFQLVIILLFVSIINSIIPYATMINTQILINKIQMTQSLENIIVNIIFYGILGLLSMIFLNLYNYMLIKYREYLYLHLNVLILEETKKFKLSDYENPTVYDLIQRAEQDIGMRPYNIIVSILSLFSGVINFFIAILIMTTWHWWIVIVFMFLPFVSFKYFNNITKYEYEIIYNRAQNERKSWYISHLLTKDDYIKEIRNLGLHDYLMNRFKKLRKLFFVQNININKKKTIFTALYDLLNLLISFSIVILASFEAVTGVILVGNLMTYINTSSKIETSIRNIVNAMFSLYQEAMYVDNISNYLSYDVNNDEGTTQISTIDTIEFRNVSFKYQNQNKYVLRGINLKIKKGDTIALVGKNGSGKSTLIKILSGQYSDFEGEVLINNIDIKQIDKQSLFKQINILFQDFNKFQFTIKENIGFGNLDELNNLSKIKECANISGANEFIDKLEDGYLQQVGSWFNDGVQLSGGEWQKLGISRLLMKNGDCYILDEPTAALDPVSEYEFFIRLKNNLNNKIGIFITHRFINAKFATKILVIEEGEIREYGTHVELIKSDGLYAKMFKLQNEL